MPKDTTTFPGQHEDEEVLMMFRHHPVVMRKGLIAIMLFLLFGMIPSAIKPENLQLLWFVPAGFSIGLLVFANYWVKWYYTVFVVTDQRFIHMHQEGLFSRSVVDLGLDKIQNVNYRVSGVQQTLLGFGTIVIQAFVGDLVLDMIHHPHKIQEALLKVIKDSGYTISQEEAEAYAAQVQEG